MMRLTIILLFCCMSALPAVDTTFYNVPPGQPLPQVPEYEPYQVAIPFRNPFDRAVQVVHTDSTCKCTTLEVSSKFLLPYQDATLSFEIDNRDRSGHQDQKIWLELSDPDLPRIAFQLNWLVTPAVTVDSLPLAGPFDQRPDKGRQNIYGYTTFERPDDANRLRKIMLVQSLGDQQPAGGLKISEIKYAGDLWTFAQRQQDTGSILVIASAAPRDDKLPIGKFEEKVTLITNHPVKSEIVLTFFTAISPDAGRPDGSDPWSHLR